MAATTSSSAAGASATSTNIRDGNYLQVVDSVEDELAICSYVLPYPSYYVLFIRC
uniref:Uncharacterized protein n=1 Tax=Arundo donax TaxID=35708 RepID=A0A0A9B2V5_ARUDO